ncbi:hypothetical protein EXIGLDRAFT_722504 [Exidia glandulosa HHB12029]|uniref:Uncharacterized protein n=1 Tax=Exidia glandulosa HHB12029 TaxID=1314781 RepID=A0A165F9A3_EXIGL|nr:hypothetical protein EXIGLDRAFT_722504 [Exidia glandulosa HHB12029]
MRGVETSSSRTVLCHTSRSTIFAHYLHETTQNSGTRSPVAIRKRRPQVVGSDFASLHNCAGLRGIDGEGDDSIGMTG